MKSEESKAGLLIHIARCLLSRRAVRFYWIVNIALLVGLLAWIFLDGKFSQAASIFSGFTTLVDVIIQTKSVPHYLIDRLIILNIVVFLGVVTAVGILASLFVGSSSHRNIRAWLAVMFALAAWLTLYTTWPEYAWRAQSWRVSQSLPAMEQLAESLLENWPSQDGHLPAIGPYNAYPIGSPRTLMLLTKPKLTGSNLRIASIQRGSGDDLYFQLTGSDEGATLARLPGGDQPHSYYSGLEGEYQPFRSRALGNNWFLVQYLYAPIIDGGGSSSPL